MRCSRTFLGPKRCVMLQRGAIVWRGSREAAKSDQRAKYRVAATVELELSLFVITQSANHQGIFLPVPASCLLHPIPHRLKSLILPDTSNPILHLNSIQTKQNTLHQTQWHLSSLETSSPRESSSGEYHHSHLRHTSISIESLCHGDFSYHPQ